MWDRLPLSNIYREVEMVPAIVYLAADACKADNYGESACDENIKD